jgi:hypothetical protein
MLPPNEPMVRGRKAIKELIQGWIDNIGGTISNPLMECGVDGDRAYQVATYAFKDTKTPDQGKFVEILRRQQDGTWQVYDRNRRACLQPLAAPSTRTRSAARCRNLTRLLGHLSRTPTPHERHSPLAKRK